MEEVATDLFRVKPYVYSTPDNSAVIVFSGEWTSKMALEADYVARYRMINSMGHHQQLQLMDRSCLQ